jgi:hypothetical protein
VLSDDGTLRTTKRKKEDPKEIEPYDDRDDA